MRRVFKIDWAGGIGTSIIVGGIFACTLAVVAALAPSRLLAEPGSTGLPVVALGYQQITSTATAANLTVPAGATLAIITAEAQAIRWRDDGTAPTATVGMPQAVGAPFTYGGPLANLQVIAQTTGAIVNVSYYRSP